MLKRNVILVIAGLILFSFNTFSQIINNTYNKGYIITGQDTIQCFVNDKDRYSGIIKYKIGSERKAQTIPSGIIYEIKNGPVIHKRIFTTEGSFLMQRLIKGELSLYKNYFFNDPNSFHTESMGDSQIASSIKSFWYCLVNKNHAIIIRKKGFKDDLLLIFGDNPELKEEIKILKYYELQFKIQAFVEKYNKWFENKK